MKIAFLLPNLDVGGAERVALTLAAHCVRQGHRVDMVLLQAEGQLLALLPPDVRVIDLGARRIAAGFRPLMDYLQREKPDALHAMMWPLTVVASVAHRLSGSSARLTLSDHTTLSRHYGGFGPLRRLGFRQSIRTTYPHASARIVCSQEAADDLARLSGLKRDQFDAVYNPIDLPAHLHSSKEVEAAWGVQRGRRVLSVGRLKPEKNFPLLLKAFQKVLEAEPESRLMIVGDGPERARLSDLVGALDLQGKVMLAGFDLDPWPYFASADLFVLTSDNEGFGLVLVEALAAGLPVVSTDCDHGPREILGGGEYGTLVPPREVDALAEAIIQGLRKPMDPARSRARAETVSGTSIKRWEELLLG